MSSKWAHSQTWITKRGWHKATCSCGWQTSWGTTEYVTETIAEHRRKSGLKEKESKRAR